MIEIKTDVVRLDFSYGDPKAHAELAKQIRNRTSAAGCEAGVLADIQGPKIHISRFHDDRKNNYYTLSVDAAMLSGKTAAGKNLLKTIAAVGSIYLQMENPCLSSLH